MRFTGIRAAALGLFLSLAFLLPSCTPEVALAQNQGRTSAQPVNAATLNAVLYTDLFDQQGAAAFYLTGLAASGATMAIEGSSDGRAIADAAKAWFAIPGVKTDCPSTSFTTVTTDGGFRVDTVGLTNIRVRVSVAGSGTILVSTNAVQGQLGNGACGGSPAIGNANMAAGQITVGTAATLIVPARAGRNSVTITNMGTTQFFLGNSNVTTANGFPVPGAVGASMTIPTSAAVYGIVGASTQAVGYLETY